MTKKKHTEFRDLPVKLTADELVGVARSLVETVGEIQQLEEQKKVATSDLNSRLKQYRKNERELAEKHRKGEEVRSVEVEAVYDYDAGIVRYMRTDVTPHEQVDYRPMDEFDRQEALELEDGPVAGKPKAKRQRRRKGELHLLEGGEPPAAAEATALPENELQEGETPVWDQSAAGEEPCLDTSEDNQLPTDEGRVPGEWPYKNATKEQLAEERAREAN